MAAPHPPNEKADTASTAPGWSKALVLVLLLANVLLLVWLQGWARPWGFAPVSSAEPWRVQQQIQPDQLTLLSAEDLALAELRQASLSLPCWQTGPLSEASHRALEQALQALSPAPYWQSQQVDEPERWLLFMGPYASEAVLERKLAEVKALKLNPREAPQAVTHPQWGQGLSLGRFDTAELAQQALSDVSQRGVRTARVLRDHGSRAGHMVSVWTGDAGRAQLDALLASLPASSTTPEAPRLTWQSCER